MIEKTTDQDSTGVVAYITRTQQQIREHMAINGTVQSAIFRLLNEMTTHYRFMNKRCSLEDASANAQALFNQNESLCTFQWEGIKIQLEVSHYSYVDENTPSTAIITPRSMGEDMSIDFLRGCIRVVGEERGCTYYVVTDNMSSFLQGREPIIALTEKNPVWKHSLQYLKPVTTSGGSRYEYIELVRAIAVASAF